MTRSIAVCGVVCCAMLTACVRATQLSPPGHLAYELSLATDGERMVVGWHGGSSGNAIWIRGLDAHAVPVGPPIRVTDAKLDAFEPDLQLLREDLLLAWYEKDPGTGALTAWLGRFSQQGQARWRLALSAAGAMGRNAVVRLHGDQAWVAWIETPADDQPAVWTAEVGIDGTYVQSPQRRASVSTDTWNLNAAVDTKGTFLVVYDAHTDSRARELHLLTVGQDGAAEQLLSSDDGHDSVYPDVSLSGDHAALSWVDARDGNSEIYLFVGDESALRFPMDTRGIRVTHTPDESMGAYAAWNGDRLGIAWSEGKAGNTAVYSQEFQFSGVSRGAPHRVGHGPRHASIPAISRWRSGFALAWNEYQTVIDKAGQASVSESKAVIAVMR
ncbi:MAG: hypothetical protein ABIQ86_01175 [Steroidobacteraceae bacterium]